MGFIIPVAIPFVGNDQGYLAPGYHANTDAQGLGVGVAEQLGPQAAADDLGDDGQRDGDDGEQDDGPIHGGEGDFQAHTGKKDGGEEHVGEGLTLGVDIDGPGGVGDHQAGEEGADDIRHTEDLLRHIGIEEAESQGDDGEALPVPGGRVHPPLDQPVEEVASHAGNNKESHDLDHHDAKADAAVRGTGDQGQQDQPQNIIDQGSTQDGVAERVDSLPISFRVSTLMETGGGGEYGAHEHVLQEGTPVVEDLGQDIAARQGDQHADQGDEKGGFAGFFQLLDVGLESGAEHEHHHAQLGEHSEEVTGLDQVEDAGPQQQAGPAESLHLGLSTRLVSMAKHFVTRQDRATSKIK